MISVWVPGTPVAQGSMSAYVVGNRAVITDQKRKSLKPWREAVIAAVVETGAWFGGDGPVAVRLEFVLQRPKSVRRALPSVRPDLDKLCRSVLDALTGSGCVKDDSQVVDLAATKRYGDLPGVRIEVREAGREEGTQW